MQITETGLLHGRWSNITSIISLNRRLMAEALMNASSYGRQFHIPFKNLSIDPVLREKWITSLNDYFEKLHPSILAFQVARYQKLLKRDKNDCPVLEIGSKCLIWKPAFRKLNRVWYGPFTIHKRISKDSYIVKDTVTRREYRRHINLIRPLKNGPLENLATDENKAPGSTDAESSTEEKVHDVRDLNESCPGTDARIESWSNRLRPRKQ